MKEYKIIIKELLGGDIAISMAKGKNLYDLLLQNINNHDKIILDFDGVTIFASPFFNASIGYLLKDFDIKDLQLKLSFTNLNGVGLNLLNLVISNAIQTYEKVKADPNYEKFINSTVLNSDD